MPEIAALISALSALLWPVLGFTIICIFKSEIKELLGRLKKGKLLGQELELEPALKELQSNAVAVAKEVDALPGKASQTGSHDEVEVTEILKHATASPKAALVLLSAAIERELRECMAGLGFFQGRNRIIVSEAVRELSLRTGNMPEHLADSIKNFIAVRNRIVHGRDSTSDEVLSALDSGIMILRSLKAIPHQTHTVYHPGVPVYSDSEATVLLPGAKGVIIESTSAGGIKTKRRIFPTTKTHYKKAQTICWEWNEQATWGPAWYRDSDSGVVKEAWTSSCEFVGRGLKDML